MASTAARRLRRFGGDVVLRATGGNLGFSGGCNAGIRDALSAGATAVLLVNSDVIVPPDCVALLMDALARQPRPGIVAPIVRSRVWPGQVLSAGIDYDTGTGRMRHRLGPRRRGHLGQRMRDARPPLGLRSDWPAPRGVLLLVRGHRVLPTRAEPKDSTSGSNRARPCITRGAARWGPARGGCITQRAITCGSAPRPGAVVLASRRATVRHCRLQSRARRHGPRRRAARASGRGEPRYRRPPARSLR